MVGTNVKVVWSSVATTHGELCVMTSGPTRMQVWYVLSSASPELVSVTLALLASST